MFVSVLPAAISPQDHTPMVIGYIGMCKLRYVLLMCLHITRLIVLSDK